MFTSLFWVILRSIAIPYVAFQILKEWEILGEKGALLAIGIALLLTTLVSILWNTFKILGNTLLLRAKVVLTLILKVVIQIVAVFLIWGYYFSEYTDVLD